MVSEGNINATSTINVMLDVGKKSKEKKRSKKIEEVSVGLTLSEAIKIHAILDAELSDDE